MVKRRASYRRMAAADDLYVVGTWHGVAHYRCTLCPFDTLDATAMLEHVAGHLAAPSGGDAQTGQSETTEHGG